MQTLNPRLLAIASAAVVLVACCPGSPGCPPSPALAVQWRDQLASGQFEEVIASTDEIITNPESPDYAEAFLFRGLAELGISEDQAAYEHLILAEELQADLITFDQDRELALLYRGLMVAAARLGEIDQAEAYRAQAIELTPEQADIINQEFEMQTLNYEALNLGDPVGQPVEEESDGNGD